jgi:hypothetical protein
MERRERKIVDASPKEAEFRLKPLRIFIVYMFADRQG